MKFGQQFKFLLLLRCQFKFGFDDDFFLAVRFRLGSVFENKLGKKLAHTDFVVQAILQYLLVLLPGDPSDQSMLARCLASRPERTAEIRSEEHTSELQSR